MAGRTTGQREGLSEIEDGSDQHRAGEVRDAERSGRTSLGPRPPLIVTSHVLGKECVGSCWVGGEMM